MVCCDELGAVVPFDDAQKLENALARALDRKWSTEEIVSYAANNSWDSRVEVLIDIFGTLFGEKNKKVSPR